MLKLAGLAFIVWITATFIAGWIDNLRTGVATLVGPYVRVRRATHRIGYFAAMVLLFVPAAASLAVTLVYAWMAFPYQYVPAPPRKGYAQPLQPASGLNSYFPVSLTRTTFQCAQFPKPVPLITPEEIAWYSRPLAAAGEPSLLAGLKSTAQAHNVYRFTWLRSFDKPVVVRVQEGPGGVFVMAASRLSGQGGYGPGAVEARVERRLTAAEAAQFSKALAGTNRLRLKAVTCERGFDGAEWIFEAADRGAYRYVNRWSPKTGAVRALGLTMLSLTGWPTGPMY